jgi:hypothetical protein
MKSYQRHKVSWSYLVKINLIWNLSVLSCNWNYGLDPVPKDSVVGFGLLSSLCSPN